VTQKRDRARQIIRQKNGLEINDLRNSLMERFEISETYRKYFIVIKLKNGSFYTVWGTDLSDEDNDKLLVKNKKLLLFKTTETFIVQISNYRDAFFDRQNFENWISEESFQETYNLINIGSLMKFSESDLSNKETALEIIDALNLIQDLFIQVHEEEAVFSSELILKFKDILYNNHFWKSDNYDSNKIDIIDPEFNKIRILLKKIYNLFIKRIQFI